MARRMVARLSLAVLTAGWLVAAPATAPAQSRELSTYVLLGGSELRATGLTVSAGDIGVNDGTLYASRPIEAPSSRIVGTRMRLHSSSSCSQLFANDVLTLAAPACGPGTPFGSPIFPNLAAACGVPAPFSSCGGARIVVAGGETRELAPGTYGDVVVTGGGGNVPGTLVLTGGNYRFCSLRASRHAQILMRAASMVHVSGRLSLSNGTFTGPTAPGMSPCSLQLLVAGDRVRFSRRAQVHARVCAPNAGLYVSSGAALQGGFVAGRIRAGRATATGANCGVASGSTTTTLFAPTTTTHPSTTTTLPGVCGNGVREGREECDGDDLGGETCATLGLGTGTLTCRADCEFDRLGCTCGNGSVDDSTGEQCDPAAAPSCGAGEECGAAGSADACTCVPASALPLEVCGNCLDDDENGLADFEDPACCPAGRSFPLSLRRGRIKGNGAGASKLRLKAILARSGLEGVNPLREDVFLQIRPEGGSDVFCARIPAGRWLKKRRSFRFRDRKHTVASALGLDVVKIKVKRGKGVRVRTKARRAQLTAPAQGRLQVTVGFRDATAGDGQNRCSSAVARFRTGRRGRLIAP